MAAGQNTPDLMVTAVNLNGATISDGAGNAANLSLTGITQGSPQIDTTVPTVSSVAATAGDYNARSTLTLQLNMSENVTVTRHAKADAQRRRHCQLCQRLRYECADFQLHGSGRAEHHCVGGDWRSTAQSADLAGNAPQCYQFAADICRPAHD